MSSSSVPDLSPYICRYGVLWLGEDPDARHRRLDGTVVFTDLSGFTALSERLTAAGRVGAEEMATRLDNVFTSLLDEARQRGGSLVHFGGDALALLFSGDGHEHRGVATAAAMGRALGPHRRMETPSGVVRLGMSTGVWSGDVDLYLLGARSRQLLIAGAAATGVTALEGAASSGEILLSPRTAAALPPSCSRPYSGGAAILARSPRAPAWTAPDIPETDVGRLLPVVLRRHLMTGGGEPEHRSVTVAFIRWTGMDALIAEHGPEVVGQRLDELVARTEELTLEWDISFLATDVAADGGKIIVAAGAPTLHEDDETRALLCMRALAAEDPGGLGVRIGLHRGHAFTAAVGAPFRRTYTCIGDTVNTAARVMVKAEPRQVLATDEVLERSRHVFAIDALPEFVAKGKALPLRAFVVGAEEGVRVVDDDAVMVGREEETELLVGAAQGSFDGTPAVVAFTGEPGAGKTRLMRHAAEQIAGRVQIYSAVSASHATDDPYATARPIVQQVLRGRAVADIAPALVPWAPLVALVTGDEVPMTHAVELLSPAFVTDKVHDVIAELFDASLTEPSLLVLDDTQWADEASRSLLQHLLARPKRRWSAWLACRPDAEPLAGDRVFALKPLPDDLAVQLVRAHAPRPLTPAHAQALVERADGNPLFLRELARTSTADLDDLPPDLETIVGARIDRLAPTDRDLLSVASVIGPVFDDDIVEQVAPQANQSSVWERLADFVDQAGEGRRRFRNAVYQQVAYARLPYRQRRTLHADVGWHLEKRDGSNAPPDQMSIHMTTAQEWPAAWVWSLRAADVAQRVYARIEEVHALQRALEAGRHAERDVRDISDVLWRLQSAAADGGQTALAVDTLHKLLRCTTGTEKARAYARLAMLFGELGERDRQLRAVRAGLAIVRQEDKSVVKADLLTTQLLDAYRADRRAAFTKYAEAAIAACTADDHGMLGEIWMIIGCQDLVLKVDSTASFTTAREHHLAANDPLKASVADSNLALAQWEGGYWQAAVSAFEAALRAQMERGHTVGAAWTAVNLGELLVEQGQLDAAAKHLAFARAGGESSGSLGLIGLTGCAEAALLLRQLRLDDARRLLDQIPAAGPDVEQGIDLRACELALLGRAGALPELRAEWPAPPLWFDRMHAIARLQSGDESGRDELWAIAIDPERPLLERALAEEARSRLPGEPPMDALLAPVFAERGIIAIATFPVRADEEPALRRL